MRFSKNGIFRLMFSLILVTVPILVIFYFSNQTGIQSLSMSNKVSKVLRSTLYMSPRKIAHIVEYAVLGGAAYTGMYIVQRRVKLSGIFVTMLLIILIASCDEINQGFVVQRGSHISDVVIDVIGGVAGIYGFIIWKDFCRKVCCVYRNLFY